MPADPADQDVVGSVPADAADRSGVAAPGGACEQAVEDGKSGRLAVEAPPVGPLEDGSGRSTVLGDPAGLDVRG